eukprot:506100-Amorphochlora_amoeboformis.AAC.1
MLISGFSVTPQGSEWRPRTFTAQIHCATLRCLRREKLPLSPPCDLPNPDPMPPTATPTVPEPPGSFRVVLIDNYDSFTYNLYQILSEFRGVEVVVMTNDTPWGVVEKAMSTAAAVIIGPGPGHPKVKLQNPTTCGLYPSFWLAERTYIDVHYGERVFCSE